MEEMEERGARGEGGKGPRKAECGMMAMRRLLARRGCGGGGGVGCGSGAKRRRKWRGGAGRETRRVHTHATYPPVCSELHRRQTLLFLHATQISQRKCFAAHSGRGCRIVHLSFYGSGASHRHVRTANTCGDKKRNLFVEVEDFSKKCSRTL